MEKKPTGIEQEEKVIVPNLDLESTEAPFEDEDESEEDDDLSDDEFDEEESD